MESAPPTYEDATLIDYLDVIARYMPLRDLTAAALVCSRWHAVFAPHIWGNPTSHFGIGDDRVYPALTRFSQNLRTARLLVRSHTHTLHMPPAHAETYARPHTDWLCDMLELLPNLQSLIVRRLPFFDHGALQALAFVRKQVVATASRSSADIEFPAATGRLHRTTSSTFPSFGLRLLDASRCPNVTSSGLASALSSFEGLLYLDLSFTYPARGSAFLASLSRFTGLQVLKLRGISLRDQGVESLCRSISQRVRSLDVRDNEITDRSVGMLLDRCSPHSPQSGAGRAVSSIEGSSSLLPYLGSEMLEVYQGENFEGYIRNIFTGRFVSRLAIEDIPESKITHLYISGNSLTVDGVSKLMMSSSFHVLDTGIVAPITVRVTTPWSNDKPGESSTPGCEKLTPILAKHAAESMTFLRIDHSIVTKDTSGVNDAVSGRHELDGKALADLPPHAGSSGSSSVQPGAHKTSANETPPRYELPGKSVRLLVSPVKDDTLHFQGLEGSVENVRRGSAFASEIIDEIAMTTAQVVNTASAPDGVTNSELPTMTFSSSPGWSGSPPTAAHHRSYSSMAMDRKARLAAHRATAHNLHPAMLPHVTTLVLTGVPPFSANTDIANSIISFIKHCAEETSLARIEAELDYTLPPGRKGHTSALKHAATKLFALKRLVLELAPTVNAPAKVSTAWQNTEMRSMTGDRDSDKLWSAAETDFSFFADEECISVTPGIGRESVSTQPPSRQQVVDNVAMISNFRRERKLAHQRTSVSGIADHDTEGLWDGKVQVVRHNNAIRSDEEIDYYGNLFPNNNFYR